VKVLNTFSFLRIKDRKSVRLMAEEEWEEELLDEDLEELEEYPEEE